MANPEFHNLGDNDPVEKMSVESMDAIKKVVRFVRDHAIVDPVITDKGFMERTEAEAQGYVICTLEDLNGES